MCCRVDFCGGHLGLLPIGNSVRQYWWWLRFFSCSSSINLCMSKVCPPKTCFSSVLGKCYNVHLLPWGSYSPSPITSFLSSLIYAPSSVALTCITFLSSTPLTPCYLTLLFFTLPAFTSWLVSLPQVLPVIQSFLYPEWGSKTEPYHNLCPIKISSNSAGYWPWDASCCHHSYLTFWP